MTDQAPSTAKSNALDVRDRQIALVYAKGLLAAVEKQGQTAALLAEYNDFVTEVLDRLPKLEDVLNSSLIGSEERLALLSKVTKGRASQLFFNFLQVLGGHERLNLIRPIRAALGELHDQQTGRVRVQVKTAQPLEATARESLAAGLRKALQAEPVLDATVDPSLLGGVVVRIGDRVFDGSVSAQLERVRREMIHRSVHEIQSRRDRFRHSGGD